MSHDPGTPVPDGSTSPTGPETGSAGWPSPAGAGQAPGPTPPYGAPAPSGYEVPSSTAPAPASPYSAPTGPTTPSPYAAPGGPVPPPGHPAPPGGQVPPPGYPAPPGGGYPAAPGYPGYGTPYPGPAAPRSTDGVSIAALVTGILGLAVVPLVLGILGLGRTRRNGTAGRGMAIAGIVLGSLQIVLYLVLGVLLAIGVSVQSDRIASLRSDCASGDMAACDRLYDEAPAGSDDEYFGATCGGTTDGTEYCVDAGQEPTAGTGTADEAMTYGDDPALDQLWDQCEAGELGVCTELYYDSPWGSDYEEFGKTCGQRVSYSPSCEDEDL